MCAFLVSLTPYIITSQIMVDYIWIDKSKDVCSSLGMTNPANEVLPLDIVGDERLWSTIVKIKQELQGIDLEQYYGSLCSSKKYGHLVTAE